MNLQTLKRTGCQEVQDLDLRRISGQRIEGPYNVIYLRELNSRCFSIRIHVGSVQGCRNTQAKLTKQTSRELLSLYRDPAYKVNNGKVLIVSELIATKWILNNDIAEYMSVGHKTFPMAYQFHINCQCSPRNQFNKSNTEDVECNVKSITQKPLCSGRYSHISRNSSLKCPVAHQCTITYWTCKHMNGISQKGNDAPILPFHRRGKQSR